MRVLIAVRLMALSALCLVPVFSQGATRPQSQLPRQIKNTPRVIEREPYQEIEDNPVIEEKADPTIKKSQATPAESEYDFVPESQRRAIVLRLQVVQKLVMRHGRAFDYRGFTTSELQKKLEELDERATPSP